MSAIEPLEARNEHNRSHHSTFVGHLGQLFANDNSLGGGLIGAVAILALNYVVAEVAYRSKRTRRLLEAQPTLLIHNGRVLHENLRRERITMDDLLAALRRAGVVEPAKVRFAVLEENGSISVVPRATEGEPGNLPGQAI